MLKHLLAVALGGALGAVSRVLVSDWVNRILHGSAFPYGTLSVNVVGSFLLGFLMGLGEERGIVPSTARVFLGIGFLGALTTFSTFSYETVEALRDGEMSVALIYVGASVFATLAACWIGLQLGGRV